MRFGGGEETAERSIGIKVIAERRRGFTAESTHGAGGRVGSQSNERGGSGSGQSGPEP